MTYGLVLVHEPGVGHSFSIYNQPFKGNCIADAAPGENEFDTPGVSW